MARILGRVLESERIKFLYYFGNLSKDQRHANIKAFESDPEIKVLVSGMAPR